MSKKTHIILYICSALGVLAVILSAVKLVSIQTNMNSYSGYEIGTCMKNETLGRSYIVEDMIKGTSIMRIIEVKEGDSAQVGQHDHYLGSDDYSYQLKSIPCPEGITL